MSLYAMVNHHRRFVVCTNAMCGSTTIREWFKFSLPDPEVYVGRTASMDFGQAVDDIDRLDDYLKLFFIRDPLQRLVSFYCYWVVAETNRNVWCFADERRSISLVGVTFREFLQVLSTLEPDQYQHHLQHQTPRVRDVRFDQVLDIEKFDMHVPRLNRLLGLDRIPRRHLHTRYDDTLTRYVPDLTPSEFGGRFPTYRYFYDDALEKLARRLYQDDIEYYRYHVLELPGDLRPVSAPADVWRDTGFRSRPRRSGGVSSGKANRRIRLSRTGRAPHFTLNDQARAVWALCDGINTPEEICSTLGDIYKSDRSTILGDVNIIMHQLYELGLLDLWDPEHAAPDGSRRIDLASIPILVINCPEDHGRRDFMQSQLDGLGLGFEFVSGVKCTPRPVGIALSHLKALSRAGLEPPFLVLEDDCKLDDSFPTTLDVPVGADAMYLGISQYGIPSPGKFGWGVPNAVRYYHYDAQHLRILNMLSRHAVVFLSERFHRSAINASIAALTNREYPYPGDIGYAMLQACHLVLTPNDPLCHQSGAHGGIQEVTSGSLQRKPPDR